MFDMINMMGKIKEVQSRLKIMKENLGTITVEGEAGGGMVKATVNGNRQVLKIEIEESLIKPSDKDILQDLIVAAVNKGMQNVDVLIKEEMKKNTEGLLPNIPGLDLSGIGNML
ncbi:MAG TPA: YbaB/EbfC family nucleoid-associated protein [Cytophagaceae bacterium]|jgi:DNA-binding YbaB/EbfC family protein|nr:YbaB/EbfC family nucleoid-associated protein [Cytophagaceae bacterium]